MSDAAFITVSRAALWPHGAELLGEQLPFHLRLAAAVALYDPTNFFRINHNIRPTVLGIRAHKKPKWRLMTNLLEPR